MEDVPELELEPLVPELAVSESALEDPESEVAVESSVLVLESPDVELEPVASVPVDEPVLEPAAPCVEADVVVPIEPS